jgi:murein DD-endopeptidase MepM/ murein hydrolase activator NlpD
MMLKLFFALFFPLILFSNDIIDIIPKKVKHGSSFAVVFISNTKQKKAPFITFKNTKYQMFTIKGDTQKYEAFIPVDYHSKKQKENIKVSIYKNKKWLPQNYTIEIIDGNYKKNEIIKVQKSKVSLSKKNKTKTSNEYGTVFKSVYSKVTLKSLTNSKEFINPMSSKITSSYGNARVYNGITKNYHTGTDFRAKVGSNIYATNDGIVALVMDRFYLGRVIYIDHGHGAYSYYAHLSKSLVKKSDTVKKGDLIAKSGKSGRVTGPHLHYAFRLHNITVDPLEYAKTYNEVVKKYH